MYKGWITFPEADKDLVRRYVTTLENIRNPEHRGKADYQEGEVTLTTEQLEAMDGFWGQWIWSLREIQTEC